MDYVYYLGKASLVIRLVHYLRQFEQCPIQFMTVLHQLDGWIVRIKPIDWSLQKQADFQSFLNELGVPYWPNERIQKVLEDLESGERPIQVMNRYHVAVIEHGMPDAHEIEVFREQFINGLGYCPETLA